LRPILAKLLKNKNSFASIFLSKIFHIPSFFFYDAPSNGVIIVMNGNNIGMQRLVTIYFSKIKIVAPLLINILQPIDPSKKHLQTLLK
jgi:hypothetical protein